MNYFSLYCKHYYNFITLSVLEPRKNFTEFCSSAAEQTARYLTELSSLQWKYFIKLHNSLLPLIYILRVQPSWCLCLSGSAPERQGQDSGGRHSSQKGSVSAGGVRGHRADREQCGELAGSGHVSWSQHMQLCGDWSLRIDVLFIYKWTGLQQYSDSHKRIQ